MKPRPIEEAKTPDLRLSLQAMKRARQRAEEIARATNTALVQMVDGKMVFVRPGEQSTSHPNSKLPGE
jgi:RNA-binding protein YhbY